VSIQSVPIRIDRGIGLKLLRAKNLNLTLPLSWTIYGDAYSIRTPLAP